MLMSMLGIAAGQLRTVPSLVVSYTETEDYIDFVRGIVVSRPVIGDPPYPDMTFSAPNGETAYIFENVDETRPLYDVYHLGADNRREFVVNTQVLFSDIVPVWSSESTRLFYVSYADGTLYTLNGIARNATGYHTQNLSCSPAVPYVCVFRQDEAYFLLDGDRNIIEPLPITPITPLNWSPTNTSFIYGTGDFGMCQGL